MGRFHSWVKLKMGHIFQAKGQQFTVENLIADPQLAEPFKNGQFATVYLSAAAIITVCICHLQAH